MSVAINPVPIERLCLSALRVYVFEHIKHFAGRWRPICARIIANVIFTMNPRAECMSPRVLISRLGLLLGAMGLFAPLALPRHSKGRTPS